jgi:hypothetical protein
MYMDFDMRSLIWGSTKIAQRSRLSSMSELLDEKPGNKRTVVTGYEVQDWYWFAEPSPKQCVGRSLP